MNSSKLGIKLISTCKNQMNRPQQQRIKEHDKARQSYVQERLERRPADRVTRVSNVKYLHHIMNRYE